MKIFKQGHLTIISWIKWNKQKKIKENAVCEVKLFYLQKPLNAKFLFTQMSKEVRNCRPSDWKTGRLRRVKCLAIAGTDRKSNLWLTLATMQQPQDYIWQQQTPLYKKKMKDTELITGYKADIKDNGRGFLTVHPIVSSFKIYKTRILPKSFI